MADRSLINSAMGSWQPGSAGVSIQSSMGGGQPDGAGAALTITGTTTAATIGSPYSFTPTASGGSGTKSFSLSPASGFTEAMIPAGTSFSTTTGAITGTPALG